MKRKQLCIRYSNVMLTYNDPLFENQQFHFLLALLYIIDCLYNLNRIRNVSTFAPYFKLTQVVIILSSSFVRIKTPFFFGVDSFAFYYKNCVI